MSELRYPTDVKRDIAELEERTICGGRFTVMLKGKPVTLYCAEPRCVDSPGCTGNRLVPHMQQYTTTNSDAPEYGPRKLQPREIIEAVKEGAAKAELRGARRLEFTDTQIARYVGMVWKRTIEALRGGGGQWGV